MPCALRHRQGAAARHTLQAMFFLAILLIWALVHLYLYRRCASVPLVARVPRWVRLLAFAALPLLYFLARIVAGLGWRRAALPLEFAGAEWMGIAFLLFMTMLALDVLTGFGALWPRHAPRLRTAALAAGLALSAVAIVQGVRAPAVTDYEVHLAHLPAAQDGTTLVFLSDTHLGSMLGERWLNARIAQVNALHPDLVLLGGDILEADEESEIELLPALRRLQAPLGVWAVTGNHELHFGREEHNGRVLDAAGARVLRDQWQELRPGLVLAGVDDLTSRRRFGDIARYVDRALAGHPPQSATILVSHTPWQAERAAADGAGLMLCGHTHGGQIWPFGYFARFTYPLFAGRYEVAGMTVIVGRGTGTWGPRMRLWRRAEIVRVTLRSKAPLRASQP